jgi:tetratricopeptide (TPR) repeat protein
MRAAVFLVLFPIVPLCAQGSETALRDEYEQGEKALADKRYGDAEEAYNKLRQMAPRTAEVYAKLGLIYFQQGKYEQAVPVLRQGLKLKPGLANADTLLAMSLSELGQYNEAIPGLEKAFRRSTDVALKRMSGLQLERAYTGLQQDSKAVEIALELNRLYPNDPEVLYHTARLFGNFAFLTMRKLADVAPSSLWRHQAAGEVHESQGHYDLAVSEYRQVLTMDPRRPGMHLRIGRALLAARQGNFQNDAAKEFAQELEIDPTSANAAYELAEIYRRRGELSQAQDLFEAALKYDRDFQEAHVGLARVLLALKRPDAALLHLKRAIELDPGDAISYFHAAQAYTALGNSREQQNALAEFRRIRSQALQRQAITADGLPARQVTKQELDANAAP